MKVESLSQARAQHAYKKVDEVKQKKDVTEKEYKSLVKGFPTMIMTNGLGQAVLFLEAKGKSHHKLLLAHITDWLRSDKGGKLVSEKSLLETITECEELGLYRRLVDETMEYLNWLRRFAEAELED